MKLGQKKNGFTLTEMLVVIAIVVLLATMVLPNLSEMLSGTKTNMAKLTIESMLARAQAHAVANQLNAGIRFQFDKNRWDKGTQYMVLIEGGSGYLAVPDVKPIALPRGIGVISGAVLSEYEPDKYLDETPHPNGTNRLEDAVTFMIVFSPNGQLITQKGVVLSRADHSVNVNIDVVFGNISEVEDTPLPGGFASLLYRDNTGGFDVSARWCRWENSATALIIYELEAMSDQDPDRRYADYVSQLEPLYINRYTGYLIEEEGQ